MTPSLRSKFRQTLRDETLTLSVIAIVLGLVVGWAIVGFREAIDLVQWLAFGSTDERLASVARNLPWWQVLLAPAVAGLAVGLFFRFLAKGCGTAGPAQVIEASATVGGRMPFWKGMAATVASTISIGGGASVGREGPAVLLGATLSAWLAERLDFQRRRSRVLLGCGAAAAVAASFNAPLAGALFAHELILGHYALRAFAPVVMSSIAATLVSREVYGDYAAFIVPAVETIHWIEFPAFALTGVVCGIVATLMVVMIFRIQDSHKSVPVPLWLKPAIAGLFVGGIALVFPEVLGVGYEVTDNALQGSIELHLILLILVAKLVATAISLGGGFGGGVFSPSLTLGALAGAAAGSIATWISPELSSGAAAYALVGMGAVSAAVLGAPISTTLIIFELTSNYTLTVAVMVAVVLAVVISQNLTGRKSFFLWQLERAGLVLDGGHDVSALQRLTVKDVLKTEPVLVTPESPVLDVELKLARSMAGSVFVVQDGQFLGSISHQQVVSVPEAEVADQTAQDIARQLTPLSETDTLDHVKGRFEETGEETLPVALAEGGFGYVLSHDVLRAYTAAMTEIQSEERGRGD